MILKINSPKNYPEMLSRIKTFTTITTFICLTIMFFNIDFFKDNINYLSNYLLKELKIENISVFGIVFQTLSVLLLLLISIMIGFFFRSILLHDKISDFFRIRVNYDINIIIKPLMGEKGVIIVNSIDNKIEENRKKLMNMLFYAFAGTDKPIINIHYVYMALDSWSYYWINIETSVIVFISSIILLIFGKIIIALIFLYIFIIILFINHLRMNTCIKKTKDEINLIIELDAFKEIETGKIYDIFC